MEGAVALPREATDVDGPTSPRQRGVVGHAQLEPHQANQGANEAFGLSQTKVEQRPERQGGLNRDEGLLHLNYGFF